MHLAPVGAPRTILPLILLAVASPVAAQGTVSVTLAPTKDNTLIETTSGARSNGAGVVLGRHALATDDIAAGTLVMPFELCLPLTPAYYVVLPQAHLQRAPVAAFRDWLLAEAAANRPENAASGKVG